MFEIKIDSSKCVSLMDGSAYLDKMIFDSWRYADLSFESGKMYGIISEYGEGCMYLSYLLGGRVDFGDLQIYFNEKKVTRKDLFRMGWNLEPNRGKYKNKAVKKSIEEMIQKGKCEDSFEKIREKFILTEQRWNRKFFQLSGERWRASAALGYAAGKKIFYAPYKTSGFYNQLSGAGLIKVLRNLTESGALVLLPAGSDIFLKHIVDECVYLRDKEYDIDYLRQLYSDMYGRGDWIS